jgi:hypothetical protein
VNDHSSKCSPPLTVSVGRQGLGLRRGGFVIHCVVFLQKLSNCNNTSVFLWFLTFCFMTNKGECEENLESGFDFMERAKRLERPVRLKRSFFAPSTVGSPVLSTRSTQYSTRVLSTSTLVKYYSVLYSEVLVLHSTRVLEYSTRGVRTVL